MKQLFISSVRILISIINLFEFTAILNREFYCIPFWKSAVYALALLLFCNGNVLGQCQSTGGGGNWTTTTTWTNCAGVAPGAADDVEIVAGSPVTVDADVACDDILINDVLNHENGDQLTVNGDYTNNSTHGTAGTNSSHCILAGAGKNITGTGNTDVAGDLSITGTYTVLAAATITFGSDAVDIAGTLTNNGAVTIENGIDITGAGTWTQGSVATAILNVGNDISVTTFTATGADNTVDYKNAAGQDINATTYYNLKISGAGTKQLIGNVIVTNDITLSAGIFDLKNGGSCYKVNVAGDWLNTGATITHNNCSNSVELDGTADQNLTTNGQAFYELELDNGGAAGSDDIIMLDGLNVDNQLTITDGDLNANGFDITIETHWVNTGGTFTHGNANSVTFDGTTSDQNITSNGSSFYNLVINNGNGTAIDDMLPQDALVVLGDLTVTDGDLHHNGFDITVSGDFTIAAIGFFTHGGANTFTFDGAGEQTITSNIQPFYNVTFANTSATVGTDITLIDAMQIDNTLTMTDGYVDMGGFSLTIGTAAGTPGSLAYTADWMYNGTLTRWKATATISVGDAEGHYPLGDPSNGTGVYRPFWYANTAVFSTGGTVSVLHYGSNPAWYAPTAFTDASWSGGTDVEAVTDSYWTVSTANGLAGGTMSLQYGGTGFGTIAAITDLNSSILTGTVGTFAATGGSTADPRVNRTALTLADFNGSGSQSFRIGTKDKGASPLPITLLSFDVLRLNNSVVLNWSTASESNNEKFIIERSADDQQFEIIDEIQGAGNSMEIISYTTYDLFPLSGISYYRLTQVDYDGLEEVFPPAMIVFNEIAEPQIVLYPNPNEGNYLNVELSGFRDEVLVVVYDHLGKSYFSKVEIVENDDKHVFGIDLSDKLSSGIYFITATSDQQVFEKTLIVR